MTWPETSVSDYLNRLSRPTPRWAGGAAAAVAGAQAWALLAMAFGIIQKKVPTAPLESLLANALTSRDQLVALAEADVLAVKELSEDSSQAAWIKATRVPLAILASARLGLKAAGHPTRSQLPQAEPDFGTAEALFGACMTSTRLIITANLSMVNEPARTALDQELQDLIAP